MAEAQKHLEILVVDDSPENLEIARKAYIPYEKEGFIFTYLTKPSDAVGRIDEGKCDILITDLIFKGRDEKIHQEYLDQYVARMESLLIPEIILNCRFDVLYPGLIDRKRSILESIQTGRLTKEDIHFIREHNKNASEEELKILEPFERDVGSQNSGLSEEFPYGTFIYERNLLKNVDQKDLSRIKVNRRDIRRMNNEYYIPSNYSGIIVTDMHRHSSPYIQNFTGTPLWEVGLLLVPIMHDYQILKGLDIERNTLVTDPKYADQSSYLSGPKKSDSTYKITEEDAIKTWRTALEVKLKRIKI